ncbi:DUF2073 domain-containing protein [Candidatus Woesearchaeota archaeon]|nr:DUF2073 domain-containing protein [Candidatus Woesearchaeota archaeon]
MAPSMDLTLQFVPHNEIESLSSLGRIKKLLHLVKEDKIILLEGRLKREEETELIKATMEQIDEEFRGVEIGVFYSDQNYGDILKKIRATFVNMLMGDRIGLTVIGPASIIKEIKRDPSRFQLLAQAPKASKRKAKAKRRR